MELARYIVDELDERKAEDITLLDLRPDAIIADFFVICTGDNERHIRSLGERVREAVKEKYSKVPFSFEGTPESGWMLLDYGDVVVHIFSETQRDFYKLEELWEEVGQVLVSIQ